ncbi:AMP-binding protein [Rhodococcus sp. X156]|uniref:class I adenylate-forming enzyme family protein n=1 Tax=Rhodococcus sp. X156 TaxID=2499145 RepID=UPI000FD92181|nr:AMP-binding protein [Rhodococcus sp. X156]
MRVPLTTQDFLERAEVVWANRTAVIDEPNQPADPVPTTTYGELARRVRAWQAGLDALGVAEGDRVAVVSHNSARLLELLYAVTASGRVCVPINFRLSRDEIAYIVDNSGADVLLLDPEIAEPLMDLPVRHTFVLGAQTEDELMRFDVQPRPWSAPDEDATATINYTSGTTARPKGVQITHRNIWVNSTTFGLHTRTWERDTFLHTLPMFHCNGWGMPFTMAGMGVPQVVIRKIDGGEILRRVQEHGVTLMCAAPAVYSAVLDAAADWDGEIPGRDRVRVVCAGAPPPSRTIERIIDELGWEFLQIYGLTETSPLTTFNRTRPEDLHLLVADRAKRLSRAGSPTLGTRFSISDSGEVLVRSNTVLAGYWENPEESAKALADGWFHTGDGGTIDPDGGEVIISDRKKDVIITGGENVSSIEVEDTLFSHPSVAEAAVIGVPSEKWGETIKALVVLVDGAQVTEADLIAHCKSKLAGYKAPTSIEFREEIPRTATGKIQKFKLRKQFWADGDRQVN